MKRFLPLVILVMLAAVMAWVAYHRKASVGSAAFVAYAGPTPTPSPPPMPAGSANPASCRAPDYNSGYIFGHLINEESRQAQAALESRQYGKAVSLAKDAATRMRMCSLEGGAPENPQIDVIIANLELIEGEAYVVSGDNRGAEKLGEAATMASSAENAIGADPTTKQQAHAIGVRIARVSAKLRP
ncbi:MAG: hypothetical protein JO104_11980 [Candidatus Eremiobacteraeota bacterium]|nr:hypothetical protein [Candidatus Eremiobacteraeota bacterium]